MILRQTQDERTHGSDAMPLRIAGYAALFDLPDGAQDTIRPGAFRRTLARRGEPLPLLWQHRPGQRIGWIERAEEDRRGLRVIARLDDPRTRAGAALRSREISGLSFGYRARRYERSGKGRLLHAIDLFEISLVTHPLQHGARVHMIA